MKELLVKSGDEEVLLKTEFEDLVERIKKSQYIKHIIPDLELCDGSKTKRTPLNLELAIGKGSYECFGNTIRISADFDAIKEGQISFMIFYCLQGLSLKNSRYFVHGAAVQHEQEPYLFLGSPKSGKSTISLDLALNDDMKIYGDDSISLKILNSILILNSGNTHIGVNPKLRKNSRIKSCCSGELPPYVDSRILNLHTTESRKLRNVIILESDLFATRGSHRISANEGGLILYEHISRESRGAGYSLFSDNLPFPSNDTFFTAKKLIRTIRESDINYFIVSGSYEDMLNSCRRIIKEKDVK